MHSPVYSKWNVSVWQRAPFSSIWSESMMCWEIMWRSCCPRCWNPPDPLRNRHARLSEARIVPNDDLLVQIWLFSGSSSARAQGGSCDVTRAILGPDTRRVRATETDICTSKHPLNHHLERSKGNTQSGAMSVAGLKKQFHKATQVRAESVRYSRCWWHDAFHPHETVHHSAGGLSG